MKVTLAKTAGFCFGVKRAVHMVYDEIGGRCRFLHMDRLYTMKPWWKI